MKVLVIAAHARSLVNFRGPLLAGMVARGHEAHAAAPGLSDDTATTVSLHAMGVATHDIHFDRTGLNPAADLHALIALVRLMRRIRPDVSLGYAIKPVIWGTLAAALAGVAHRHALITGLGHVFGGAHGKRRIVQPLVRALYARALARAETVFFQNPDDAALFRTSRLVPPRARCVVVNGSGVDLDHFAPAPYPDGPPAFLMVSRLLGAKGSREYAAAARAVLTTHPQARFHLVGGFDPGPDCITPEQVSAWQDEGILTWHGPLEDVRPAIAATHVCVLPSYYGEGTPRCVLEAMAMGRPVITTDAPGCRETVVAGDNGFLVPVRQVEPLTAAMRRFLDDPALVARMGRRSAHIAEHKYDACKVSAVMLDEMGL